MDTTTTQRKPIIATVSLQAWQNNYSITLETTNFDATPILADMTPVQRDALDDGSDGTAEKFFREAVSRGLLPPHHGPFDVTVRDALDDALEADPEYFNRPQPLPGGREARHPETILKTPLTPYEIGLRNDDGDNFTTGLILVNLREAIERDSDGFLDLLSHRLIGSELLTDCVFSPVGVSGEDGDLIMKVTGRIPEDTYWDHHAEEFAAGLADRR